VTVINEKQEEGWETVLWYKTKWWDVDTHLYSSALIQTKRWWDGTFEVISSNLRPKSSLAEYSPNIMSKPGRTVQTWEDQDQLRIPVPGLAKLGSWPERVIYAGETALQAEKKAAA